MAKRKLSPQQRQSVRREIRQFIAKKKNRAEIGKLIAERYEITPITSRWYLRKIIGPRTYRSQGGTAKRQTLTFPSRSAVATTDLASLRVVDRVRSLTEKSLKRAMEAKKLIPKWQIYVKKEASLRKLEDQVKSELRVVSLKATALQRRIRALTSN